MMKRTLIVLLLLACIAIGWGIGAYLDVSSIKAQGTPGAQSSQWMVNGGGGKYLRPVSNLYGLMVPGLATSTTGCLSVNAGGWISASGSACGAGGGGSTFGQAFELTTNVFTQSALAPTTTQNLKITGVGTSTFAGGIEAWRSIGAPYFHATNTAATSTFQSTRVLNLSIGALSGLLKAGAGGFVTAATAGTDYLTAAVTAIGPTDQTSDGPTVTIATSTSASNGLTPHLVVTGVGDTLTFTSSLSGTLDNAGLTNSTVSYGGVALSLGGTDATPAFDLTDATGLPIVNGTTGTLSIARGGTATTTFYSGGVTFYNSSLGTISQAGNGDGLFWDETNKRLGVGTSTPTVPFVVVGTSHVINPAAASNFNVETYLANSNANLRLIIPGQNWALQTRGDLAGAFVFRDATNSKSPFAVEPNTPDNTLYVDSLGTVGLGTSTPQWRLQIASSSASATFRPQLTLSDTRLATLDHWSFANINGTLYLATSSATTFASSTVAALTVDASGNLGIGSTTPSFKLSVLGSGLVSGLFKVMGQLVAPIADAFTPALEGEIGTDTTSHQVKYFSGGAVRVLSPLEDGAFITATSSMGTGTTTRKVSFPQATTFTTLGGTSQGGGTFTCAIGDGTATTTYVVSSTGLTTTYTTLSANNAFTAGEAIFFEQGSVSGTVIDPGCSYGRTIAPT